MKNYEFEVKVISHENTVETNEEYKFIASDYPSFRKEFLKRFGNLVTTNKLMKQKEMIKNFSYIAENTKQFIGFVNVNTDFKINISAKEARGDNV